MADQAGGNYWQHVACRLMHGIWEQIIPTYLVYLHGIDHLDHHKHMEFRRPPTISTFRYEYDHMLIFYEPYNNNFTLKQATLLTLWDNVEHPCKRQKQIFGPTIEIISFWVDPRDMTITMPSSLKSDLITAVWKFVDTTGSCTCSLVKMDPGLDQLGFKCIPTPTSHFAIFIWINHSKIVATSTNLSQPMHHIRPHLACKPYAASLRHLHAWFNCVGSHECWYYHFFCDMCPQGLGFYCPSVNIGFCSSDLSQMNTIFFLEAICVASALAWVALDSSLVPCCLLIYTDPMDMVELFHAVWGKSEEYNTIIFFTVEILLWTKISLCVLISLGCKMQLQMPSHACSCMLY